jgi:hypothetical protein
MTTGQIYLRVCAGFANRLRATVSGICAAEEAGRPIQISWPYEPTFAGRFTDFFDLEASALPPWVTFDQPMDSSQPEYICHTMGDWEQQLSRPGAEPVYLKSYAQFYRGARFEHWLYALKPHKKYLERLLKLFGELAAPPVGIHIRRTDHWKSIKESPTEAFVCAMDEYPPGTVFFLASDSEEERIILRQKYPGRILIGAGILGRRDTVATTEGFVDFLGLSMCSEILGSSGSSFSEMAAAFGTRRLRVVNSTLN